MKARIIVSTGARLEFDDIHETLTVLELKQRVASAVAGLAAEEQRAIYRGRVLHDERTLAEIAFQDGDSINIVRGAPPVALPAASTVPSSQGAQGALGGAGGMDGDTMRMVLDNPMVQQIMSNPETLRAIILSNPEMRRLVESNPEIGHILNDPSVLRQTIQTARNPELMREMVRSSDRAMSNISSQPEGFNALRRMYNTIQEPLSQIGPGNEQPADEGDRQSSVQPAQAEAPNTAALPNPWATPSARQAAPPQLGGLPVLAPPPGLAALGALAAPRAQPPGGGASLPGAGAPGGAGVPGALPPQAPGGGMLGALASNPALMGSMVEAMQDPAMQQLLASMGAGGLGGGTQGGAAAGGMQGLPPELATLLGGGGLPLGTGAQNMLGGEQQQQQQLMLLSQLMAQQAGTANMPFGGAPFGGAPFGGAYAPFGAALAPPAQVQGGAATGGRMSEEARRAAESRYASEIQVMAGMGFDDKDKVLDALVATGGNVNAAVGRLLE